MAVTFLTNEDEKKYVKTINDTAPDENGNIVVKGEGIAYDNTVSGIDATTVQGAIDKLSGGYEPGGTTDHSQLSNRDAADQHPIEAITGLREILDEVKEHPGGNTDLGGFTQAQINALHGMFKVCLFDDTKDVDGAISAFETAFGITGGGEVPDQPEQPDEPGGESGGTTADALPTNGLMAYFDLRNLGDKANVTVGTTKGVMATQGSGALFSWASQPITSSNEYGVKTDRGMMFSAEGNTTQTDLGTEFTVISFGYGECIGPGIHATNIDPRWRFMPSYNKADGTAKAAATNGSELNGDNMKDYNFAVYRVSGAILTLINDTSRKDYNGKDYEGFVSWDSKPTMGATYYSAGYGTAVAIYDHALSDVEIEEARAFMKTLEVTA